MARQNTRLEAEGAEFLVLGNLLMRGIPAYKTYTNMPGYDVIAVNPAANLSARIQVKSRWRSGADGFIIRNFDADFVVVALLNRGSRDGRKDSAASAFYVLPIAVVADAPRTGGWGKVAMSRIPDLPLYREAWYLVQGFLQMQTSSAAPADPEDLAD